MVWRALGTGSGNASPLNPFGLHPLPVAPLVMTPRAIAEKLPTREVDPSVPGFGLRPLTSARQRPFGLGSERQLAAFVRGPHMSCPPSNNFSEPFKQAFTNRPPCFASPPQMAALHEMRTMSRRHLSSTGISPRNEGAYSSVSYSPRANLVQPEEAGAGLIVNGGAREPRAFRGRHAERMTGYNAHGATPYPGMWLWPTLDQDDLEDRH